MDSLSRDNCQNWLCLLPKRGVLLKERICYQGKQILSFIVDPFSEGAWCTGKQTRSYESYLPCKMVENLSSVSNPLNSSHAKVQRPFVVCFLILTNHCLERRLYVKLNDWMSNSVDPDEMAHWAISSGSMLFAKAYFFRLWQWKSSSSLAGKAPKGLLANSADLYQKLQTVVSDQGLHCLH